MPRWASRISLEIVNVHVERLQNISAEDVWREGVDRIYANSPVSGFCELWSSINAERGYPWESNPWVWVISFKQFKGD